MRRKKHILVLFGGRSAEHEVSITSARSVIGQLNRKKYHIIPLAIAKDGRWLSWEESWKVLLKNSGGNRRQKEVLLEVRTGETKRGLGERVKDFSKNWLSLKKNVDVVFPVLHGPYGEDGTLQGLLEILDLPYVGSGVLGSALGMDKIIQKKIFSFEKLPVVPWIYFSDQQWKKEREKILKKIGQNFSFPVFIKPCCLGSSIGISKAYNEREVRKGIREALRYDERILIEQGIEAREIECSVLGKRGELRASLPGEILPSEEFYSYQAKYLSQESRLIIPALLEKKLTKKIQEMALKAFESLECFGMARVDFLINKNTSQVFVNEVNTIPGFTSISMYPKLWEASGLSYPKLLDILIELAEDRHLERKKREASPCPGT